MDHRFSGFLRRLSIILFWIVLWQTAASLIRNHIFLVGPADTLRALCEQILLPDFWSAIAFSFWRISIGFFLASKPGSLPPLSSGFSQDQFF